MVLKAHLWSLIFTKALHTMWYLPVLFCSSNKCIEKQQMNVLLFEMYYYKTLNENILKVCEIFAHFFRLEWNRNKTFTYLRIWTSIFLKYSLFITTNNNIELVNCAIILIHFTKYISCRFRDQKWKSGNLKLKSLLNYKGSHSLSNKSVLSLFSDVHNNGTKREAILEVLLWTSRTFDFLSEMCLSCLS